MKTPFRMFRRRPECGTFSPSSLLEFNEFSAPDLARVM